MKKLRKRLSFFLVLALIMQMLTPLSNANELGTGLINDTGQISVSDEINKSSDETNSSKSISEISSMSVGQQIDAQGIVLTNQGLLDDDEDDKSFYIVDEETSDIILAKTNEDFDLEVGSNIRFSAYLNKEEEEEDLQLENITTMSILKVNMQAFKEKHYEIKKLGELSKKDHKSFISLKNVKIKKIGRVNKASKNINLTIYDDEGNQLNVSANIKDTGLTLDEIKKKVAEKDTIDIRGSYVNTNKKGKHIELLYISSIDDIQLVKKYNPKEENYQEMTIAQIQGDGHKTPYINKKVLVKDVVVTRVSKTTEFFVQSLKPDNDNKTSDGIKVSLKNHKLEVGDKVQIKGLVEEKTGEGYQDEKEKGLTITSILADEVEEYGKVELPKPIKIYDNIPRSKIDDDNLTVFEPNDDAIDYLESIEGMLVEIEKPKIVSPLKNGEIYVVSENYNGLNSAGAVNIDEKRYNLSVFCLYIPNKINKRTVKPKDSFSKNVVGALDYGYSKYRISTSADYLDSVVDGGLKREGSSLKPEKDKLLIASYNIENFSANPKTTKDEKVEKIAKSVVEELNNPDIITVIEMQDNNGKEESENTDASQSAKRLSDAIRANGGKNYEYVDIAPINNQDGGAPGSNIRLGFFYNPQRVQLKDKEKGNAVTAGIYTKDKGFNFNPVRVNPTSESFKSTRKSLAGEFVFNGQDIIVISNHLSSKRGELPLFGIKQPVEFESEIKRMGQVSEVKKFVNQIQEQNSNAKIVLTGDFNDFEFSNPLKHMVNDGRLVNLVENYPQENRFAYSFNGLAQCLDHVLISKNIQDDAKLDIVHVNSMFMEEHGRASDHDPLLVQIDLSKKDEDKKEDGNKPKEGEKPNKPKDENEQKPPQGEDNKPEQPNTPNPKPPIKPEIPKVEDGYKTVAQLKNLPIGEKFKAEVVVAVSSQLLSGKHIYFADENSPLCIIGNTKEELEKLEIGDKVQISGKKTKTGLSDINTIDIKEKNVKLPFETKRIEEINENTDLNLIEVRNVKLTSIKKDKKGNIQIKISDEQGKELDVFIYSKSKISLNQINEKIKIGEKLNIYGLYFHKNKQLRPFLSEHIDIIKEEQPPAPKPKEKILLTVEVKLDGVSEQHISKVILYKNDKLGEFKTIKGSSTQTFEVDKELYEKNAYRIELEETKEFEIKRQIIDTKYIFTITKKEKPKTNKIKISQIQGETHTSSHNKETVELEDAVVTYISGENNFFVQSLEPDNNINTSEGIEIYSRNNKVKIGDKVSIKGKVNEFVFAPNSAKYLKDTDLSTTQISAKSTDIKVIGTENLPKPVIIGKDRIIPNEYISSHNRLEFNSEKYAIDFWESLEGMLVQVEKPQIIAPQKYGEIHVVPNDFRGLNALGGLTINPANNTNLNDIVLSPENGKEIIVKQQDRISKDIIGVVGYGFSKYKISVPEISKSDIEEKDIVKEKTSLKSTDDKLLIASYNIENFSAINSSKKGTTDEKVQKIAESMINNLNNPDIIAVIEMQDNSGETDNGITDASQSAKRLSDKIHQLGGRDYKYVDIEPINNQDGGAPGANIRLGFFYDDSRVTLKQKGKGDASTSAVYTKDKGLNFNPVRVNPTSEAFKSTRKSLAGEFVFNGQDIIVIANHLSSKRGDSPLFGKEQPPTLKSEKRKMEQVGVIAEFVNQIQNENPNANIVLTGDFNDFEFSRPLKSLTSATNLTNLVLSYDENRRFAYSFNGINQTLDHILVSDNLKDKSVFDIVHINSPYMEQHGRASDHDPLLVQLELPKKEEIEKITVTAEVEWKDVSNPENQKAILQLYRTYRKDGKSIEEKVEEREVIGNTKTEFTNLDKTLDGNIKYDYELKVKEIPGFNTIIKEDSTKFKVLNVKKETPQPQPNPIEKVTLKAMVKWENVDKVEEQKTVIELYRDNVKIKEKVVVGNETVEFKDLNKTTKDRKPYNYEIKQKELKYFDVDVQTNKEKTEYTFTNKSQPIEKVTLKAEVKWVGVDKVEEQKTLIKLIQDNKVIKTEEVVGNGIIEFKDLDKTTKDRIPYNYEIRQKEVKGFETKVQLDFNKYKFINTKKIEPKPEQPKPEQPKSEQPKPKPDDRQSGGTGGRSSGSRSSNTSRDNTITPNRVLVAQQGSTITVNDEDVPRGVVQKQSIFEDIKGHWAEDVIGKVAKKGYFLGTTDKTFSPNDNITRAQFVTVLGRMSAVTAKLRENTFKDVSKDAYYTQYIAWAVENNFIKGYTDGTFRPNYNITREELSVILAKYLKEYNKKQIIELEFTDKNQISDWAIDSVKLMVELGVLNGRTNNTFGAKDYLTRAEMAQIIENIEKLLDK